MEYNVRILWKRKPNESFTDNQYDRTHKWIFDGGTELIASSSPHVVPVPLSNETAVDPEESFVAALSSCHMLFFLSLAAKQNYSIDSYEDHAEGIMSKNTDGKMAMTVITLKPKTTFSGSVIPTQKQIKALHTTAHKRCYIANSVKSEVIISI